MSTKATPLTDQLEKATLDNHQYQIVQLKNFLEMLLVHDLQTDKASTSISVNAGSFLDSSLQGKAHAVEVYKLTMLIILENYTAADCKTNLAYAVLRFWKGESSYHNQVEGVLTWFTKVS